MGYEVKKVIEFGREKEKPVGLLKGAILIKDGKEPVLQLKLRNNGKDILNKVTVKIICIGKDGQIIGEQNYTYEKIFITTGTEFGTDVAIPLKYNGVESVSVEIERDLEGLKVSSKKVLTNEWNPAVFPKIYNIVMTLLSASFLIYQIVVLINWNLLIKGQIHYSPWIGGIAYGTRGQSVFAILFTTAIYLYPMTQVLLNKNQINYKKLVISNLSQILMVLVLISEKIVNEMTITGISIQDYIYIFLIGYLILVLIQTIMIESIRNKIYILLMGLITILIAFIYYKSTYWYNLEVSSNIVIICEYLKLCINIIGIVVITKKKFKLI